MPRRAVSPAKKDFMDTSDEHQLIESDNSPTSISDLMCQQNSSQPTQELTPNDQAGKIVEEAERGKAKMFEVPGKINISQIDEDYQMINAHVEDGLKRKILALEYIDLAKLLVKNKRYSREDEGQRLEIINKNGQSFLSPVSDRDSLSINSYGRWEQAFRIFSNIITTQFPSKASELLQYNHTIHMASTTYSWENVYSYDKEFRHHIARHPYWSWSVILQQAWTMILKDRVKTDGNYRGVSGFKNNRSGGGHKEICKQFNRGKCTFGLSCRYDHRCAVPKCGKFGHGAHICHLCNTDYESNNATTAVRESYTNGNSNNNNNMQGKK